jgi:hypothetical protein
LRSGPECGVIGFQPGCATIRSASPIVIPGGRLLNRMSLPSPPSVQVPMRIPPSPLGRGIEQTMSIRFRAANRRSSKALAAARDWLEPSPKSPGLIQSTCKLQICQPGESGKCIGDPAALVSQSLQAERAYLDPGRFSWPLGAPVQPPAIAESLEGIYLARPVCYPFPGPSYALFQAICSPSPT